VTRDSREGTWRGAGCGDLGLRRRPGPPLAGDEEPDVGQLAHDERRRGDQMLLTLVGDEGGHVAHNRRAVRQPERGVSVDSPAITIKPAFMGSWLLKVEGFNQTVRVRRIK